jgi:hypothetical protein
MKHDDLEGILSREENILPSSGFTARVMGAVQREASAPPPIPFPWKCAWAGLALAGLAVMAVFIGLAVLVRGALAPQLPATRPSMLLPILQAAMSSGTGEIILALLATLAAVKLSMRLTSD